MCLAGLYAALPLLHSPRLREQSLLFLGAGEAGIGIADLVVRAMVADGLTEDAARRRCWFVDSHGLVVRSRGDLAEHKRPYAHEHEWLPDLTAAINALRPTALVGVSGRPRTFTRAAIEAMAAINDRPLVFALSNPTANSECTAADAYAWSDGRAIFASGSPFQPVEHGGWTFTPRQANNAYIFPGLGLGIIACGARRVTDEMFLSAARTLAAAVEGADLRRGALFPPLCRIRDVSAFIAAAVARVAYEQKLATVPEPQDLGALVRAQVYDPTYESYV